MPRRKRQLTERERLLADLKLLMGYIPEEKQGDETYYASNRIWSFINHHANQTDYFPASGS